MNGLVATICENLTWLPWFALGLSMIYLISGIDDFFIDLVAWLKGLRPEELTQETIRRLGTQKQKRIAIIVPAWKEGRIIARMLQGNTDRILYQNYDFFVGVYPNDPESVDEVNRISQTFPHVHAVVNLKPGPSSKGQMLNRVFQAICEFERETGAHFDGFLMQDSEDIVHPNILQLVNDRLEHYDFVQTPVFSLVVRRGQLVASTYMDEFAEHHTKDLLVRNHLKAAIPSAGVGTALSRELIDSMRRELGHVFNEGSLTEDYELGVTAHRLGFRSHFACAFYRTAEGKREFIATREYFPKKVKRSIRQKARWSIGICLQGWRNLGWKGPLKDRYFLYRDRKGLFTNPTVFLNYPCLILLLVFPNLSFSFGSKFEFGCLLAVNVALMANRLFQRAVSVSRVYGISATFPIPLIWPVANFINAAATLSAIRQDIVSRFTRRAVAWVKTEHELPEFFGGRTVQRAK